MAPIRTAIIGLSSSAKTSWASNAHLPYLLSARGRSKYQIVALCNSTVDAARNAIKHYKLAPETRAYGDPDSLAKDPDIDLIVVCTRVDVHHKTALPSVKAGKTIFVEWPLAQDPEHARELAELAKNNGNGQTLVGLQGRLAPALVKVRDLVASGRVGKLLSSEVRAAGGTNQRDQLPPGLKYFTQRSIGGNIVTIGLGHLFDQIQSVLGDISHIQSRAHIQRPDVKIRDLGTGEIVETVRSDVPDLVLFTGTLSASKTTQAGAPVLVRFRKGTPFPGEPALVWTLSGERGEIRLVIPTGAGLHAYSYSEPVTIDVHDFDTDKVERVVWQWEAWQEELPALSRSIAAIYDRFADGNRDGLVSFDDAAFRHEQLSGILESLDVDG